MGQPHIGSLELYGRHGSMPKGHTTPADRPGPRMKLMHFDVAERLRDPDFAPPKVKRLTLHRCLLPGDRTALDFPGVTVDIT
ncbi:hypothetical protein ACFXDH_31390 [Streptomyces sp. NPDC059467]|uniref:hypothetical protein n=1 Tax=Streptomyces sp. NPDC059467 TaxID=3346844 RepID=UPI0036A333B6